MAKVDERMRRTHDHVTAAIMRPIERECRARENRRRWRAIDGPAPELLRPNKHRSALS